MTKATKATKARIAISGQVLVVATENELQED